MKLEVLTAFNIETVALWDMPPYDLLFRSGSFSFGIPWTLYLCKKHSTVEDESWIYIVADCMTDYMFWTETACVIIRM